MATGAPPSGSDLQGFLVRRVCGGTRRLREIPAPGLVEIFAVVGDRIPPLPNAEKIRVTASSSSERFAVQCAIDGRVRKGEPLAPKLPTFKSGAGPEYSTKLTMSPQQRRQLSSPVRRG